MAKKQCAVCGRRIVGDYHWLYDERQGCSVKVCKEDRECYVKFRQLLKEGGKKYA